MHPDPFLRNPFPAASALSNARRGARASGPLPPQHHTCVRHRPHDSCWILAHPFGPSQVTTVALTFDWSFSAAITISRLVRASKANHASAFSWLTTTNCDLSLPTSCSPSACRRV